MTSKMKHAVPLLAVFILQLPVFIVLASANVNAMNPDGAVYIRLADYWLRGQFDLAVSGYWGPMLSWIIAPFRLLEGHPGLAARVGTAISAIVFLAGGMRVLLVCRLPRPLIVGGSALIALMAAVWSVAVIAPDLLAGGLMLLGLSFLLEPGETGAGKRPIVGGVLLGSAYLAKAVALPLGLGIVLLLAVLRAVIGAASRSAATHSAARSLLALALVALPWILVLSLHYGQPTFSTSGRIALALAERTERLPGELKHRGLAHPSFLVFHSPRPGRISSWEDPTEMEYSDGRAAAASTSRQAAPGLLKQKLKRVAESTATILEIIKGWDLLGLGVVTMVLGFFFHFPWRDGFHRDPWRLSLCVGAPLVALYALVSPVEAPRYFLVAYPLLVASAAGFCTLLATTATSESESASGVWPRRIAQGLATLLVLLVFAYPLAFELRDTARGGWNQPQYALARDLASEIGTGDEAIAEISRGHVGYYAAYLTVRPWHGRSLGAPSIAEISASGAELFVVDRGSSVDVALAASAQFEALEAFPTPISGRPVDTWPFRVYRLLRPVD